MKSGLLHQGMWLDNDDMGRTLLRLLRFCMGDLSTTGAGQGFEIGSQSCSYAARLTLATMTYSGLLILARVPNIIRVGRLDLPW
jgi:hypothetical protein